jgi:hypothetical protein
MMPINPSAETSLGALSASSAGAESRKPWSTPLVIVSQMQNSENNNNGPNSDAITSGIPIGNS